MNEQELLFIDIEPKSTSQTPAEGRSGNRLWTRSDNDFRFNFFSDSSPAPQEKTPPPVRTEAPAGHISFTGHGSPFVFNFPIPPVPSEEDMETAENAGATSSGSQEPVKETKPSQEAESLSESSVQSKAKKKKKKSGKKKPSSTEPQQKPDEEVERSEEPSAEEQLNRQLDWCIEQLELGLTSQKGTPKQKEEASRALKTLRSSKAPLVKKRQLMRAMTGDYRKKMEEEKSKQFKLIQSELASAQVKVVSESPKKSVFHRKAEVKTQTCAAEKSVQKTEGWNAELTPQTQEEKAAFVFVPSNEEFHFNFL